MDFFCLSGRPNKPCNVITLDSCKVMLDCGLDMASICHFLPLPLVPSHRLNALNTWVPRDTDSQLEGELRECNNRVFVDSPPEFCVPCTALVDFSQLDAILISNYLTMLGLPFVTNDTGFKGMILMTEPTLQLGRLLMEELVTYIERTPKAKHATRWKNYLRLLPSPLSDVKSPKRWEPCYSMKAINESLSHVHIVAYNEKVDICGVANVVAVSSGFGLGSCNWIINSNQDKVVYLSSSSVVTTHPRPMEQQLLRNADVVIVTALNHTPMFSPDNVFMDFCAAVATTVRNGGSALVPCYPSGVLYDLFECLSQHLDSVGMSLIPLYFVSPLADSSLAYSNIFSEWLSVGKQNKVYELEDPFLHGHLTKTGRLKYFKCLHAEGFSQEYRQPCIVFCGHPSLRFGDAVHFLEMWGNNPQNAILFTEPEFDYLEALAPFQPLAIRPVYCPIDTSLNFVQAKEILSDLKPKKLMVPDIYLKPPMLAPHRSDLVLDLEEEPIIFSEYGVQSVELERHFESASIVPELAETLSPITVRPGLIAATLNAELHVQDNKYTLKPIMSKELAKKLPVCYPYGSASANAILERLAQAGITDARLKEDSDECVITIGNEEATIKIKGCSTHVFTSGSQLRVKLKEVLFDCLNKF